MTTAIDLFAGLGGWSTGATMAGVNVLWAANHWPVAVEWHSHNHPDCIHVCQDLNQADFTQAPSHDILLASPCCQGHSKARGKANGNPQHDSSRSTAWAVVSAAECHRPPVAIVENVPEFTQWALYPARRAADRVQPNEARPVAQRGGSDQLCRLAGLGAGDRAGELTTPPLPAKITAHTIHGGIAMLVLTRKTDQSLHIGDTKITVTAVEGGQVKLGIEAPDHVEVLRSELIRRSATPRTPDRAPDKQATPSPEPSRPPHHQP